MVEIQIFGVKIQLFDTFYDEIFKNIFFWRKNSNISKRKVLLKNWIFGQK